jgi:heme exporter protein D
LASVKSRVTSVLKIVSDFMQSKEVLTEQISKLERERRLKNDKDLEEL